MPQAKKKLRSRSVTSPTNAKTYTNDNRPLWTLRLFLCSRFCWIWMFHVWVFYDWGWGGYDGTEFPHCRDCHWGSIGRYWINYGYSVHCAVYMHCKWHQKWIRSQGGLVALCMTIPTTTTTTTAHAAVENFIADTHDKIKTIPYSCDLLLFNGDGFLTLTSSFLGLFERGITLAYVGCLRITWIFASPH